ncbi:hypothetical protein BaRGS_00027113 [Batillaria attramentaria]|uniref:Uncharacterized protein n=1 Tax=Batillaria attramentaria TaxID=370345 RepID=A0ABD0K2I2_9CAEN
MTNRKLCQRLLEFSESFGRGVVTENQKRCYRVRERKFLARSRVIERDGTRHCAEDDGQGAALEPHQDAGSWK